MEENKEEFVYYNDEWNGSLIDDPRIKKCQEMYNFCLEKSNKLLEEELKSDKHLNKTYLPEEISKEIIKNNKPDGRRYKK